MLTTLLFYPACMCFFCTLFISVYDAVPDEWRSDGLPVKAEIQSDESKLLICFFLGADCGLHDKARRSLGSVKVALSGCNSIPVLCACFMRKSELEFFGVV